MTFQSFLRIAWSISIFYSYLPFVFSILILHKNIVPLGPSLTAIFFYFQLQGTCWTIDNWRSSWPLPRSRRCKTFTSLLPYINFFNY